MYGIKPINVLTNKTDFTKLEIKILPTAFFFKFAVLNATSFLINKQIMQNTIYMYKF